MSTAGRMKAIGFLVSLAIHVSAAAIAVPIALSLGRPVPPLSSGDVRDPDGRRANAPSRDLISRPPGQSLDPHVPSETVAAVPQDSDASNRPLERRAVLPQPPVESPSRRDAWSMVRPIERLANSDQPDAGTWLNHLWQSTIFALAVGLLTIACRRNHARVRYWLWFSSSVKFFIPFSVLVMLGSRLPLPSPATTTAVVPAVSSTMAQVSQPFLEGGSSGVATALSAPGSAGWIGLAILALWACGFAGIVVLRVRMWWRIRRAVHTSAAVDIPYVVVPPNVQVRADSGLDGAGGRRIVAPHHPVAGGHRGASHAARNSKQSSRTSSVTSDAVTISPPQCTWSSKRCSGSTRWCGGSEPGWCTSVSAPATKKCSARSVNRECMPKESSTSASATWTRGSRASQA